LPARLPARLAVRLPARLAARLPARLAARLAARLPARLAARLPARLAVRLPARLAVRLPVRLRARLQTSNFRLPSGPPVCLLFHGGQHLHEPADVVARHSRGGGPLEIREVTMHARGHAASLRGWRDDEGAAVRVTYGAGDEAARRQAIQDARQGGALVGEAAMQVGDRRRTGGREQREDVRLALRQRLVFQASEVEADAVRGAVNRGHESKRHRRL